MRGHDSWAAMSTPTSKPAAAQNMVAMTPAFTTLSEY